MQQIAGSYCLIIIICDQLCMRKIGLINMCTKYTYLTFCVSYTGSVSCITLPMLAVALVTTVNYVYV